MDQRASGPGLTQLGGTWKSSLHSLVQLTLPRMAFQILWLPSGWGGVGSSFTEFWFMRPGITRLQAGTEVATIYSNFLNLATWTLNRNKLITKVGFHTTTHHHTTNCPPQPTSNHQLLDLNVSKVMVCNLEGKKCMPLLIVPFMTLTSISVQGFSSILVRPNC